MVGPSGALTGFAWGADVKRSLLTREGLVGQPVGSKLLLSVPPERGYGQRSMVPIPGGCTLVFVMDVP